MSQKCILCLDDDEEVLQIRKLLLESRGYKVLTAQSGEEALSILETGTHIDAVLLDYLMPGMNGDEFASKLRQKFPELPAVVVSAVGQLPESLLKNVQGSVLKGQDPEILLSVISRITGQGTESAAANSEKQTILCVDDEEFELDARRSLLESAGFRVLQTRSAEQAMEFFRSQPIDAVVMDYWLYGNRNGTSLAEEMKRLRPNVPVVMLSGLAALPGESAIVDTWISKGGGNPEKLINEVTRLIKRRNSEKENS